MVFPTRTACAYPYVSSQGTPKCATSFPCPICVSMRAPGDIATVTMNRDQSATKNNLSGTRAKVSSFRNQKRGSLVLDKKHQELGSSGLAGVSRDGVHVVWVLVERVARHQSDGALAFHLHHDRPLEHIDHDLCMVCVCRVRRAGRVLDGDHRKFLSRSPREIPR